MRFATSLQSLARLWDGTQSRPVGLHFSDEQVLAAQCAGRATADAPALRAWGSRDIPVQRDALLSDGKQLRLTLRELWKATGLHGSDVVTAMPPDKVRLTPLTFTTDPRVTEGERVLKLMADRLDGDLADHVIDYVAIRNGPGESDRAVLVAVCRRDDVISYLEALRLAGLKVRALQTGPVAINRCLSALPGSSQHQTQLVINFGRSRSYLTVVSGRRLLLDQDLAFGEQTVLERIGRVLELDPDRARALIMQRGVGTASATERPADETLAEIVRPSLQRLADEVRRVSGYVAAQHQGNAIGQVFILGSIARWPGAAGLLAGVTGLPVSCDLPVGELAGDAGGRRGQGARPPGPDLVIAVGLALYGT